MAKILPSIAFAALVLSTPVLAQELDQKAKHGIWSVMCPKDNPKAGCSVVAAVHADKTVDVWAKVGLFLTDKQLEMLLRMPRLSNMREGVALGFDGKQFGRAFIDRCDLTSCEATITVGPELRNLIGTRGKMTIQYPINETEGEALAFDLDGIVTALGYLQKPDTRSELVASVQDWHKASYIKEAEKEKLARYVRVERRQLPNPVSPKQADKTWSQPLHECGATPPVKEIRVNAEIDIDNEADLRRWLVGSKKCGEVLVWVVPKKSAPVERTASSGLDRNLLALYRVYGSVKEEMPQVVISLDEKNRIPIQGSAAPEIMAYSSTLR